MNMRVNDMKANLLRSLVGLVLLCYGLSLGPSLLAYPSPPAALLTQAYSALAQADHDYKGHRVNAMKQVQAAGKILGVNVRGDGKGHERQGVSDAQLRTAQGLLQQARASLSGKALKHVDKALQEISLSLSIK